MNKLAILAAASVAFASGAATAADLPSRRIAPAPYVAVPVFTWTGFYFGGNVGYAATASGTVSTVGNDALTVANVASNFRPGSFKVETDGWQAGGQIGYNYQIGSFVLGIEADAQATDLFKTSNFISGRGDISSFRQTTQYIGTVRGRIGYAFDRIMIYGTGGFAYGDVYNRANFFSFANPAILQFRGARDDTETGYTVGGGVEWAPANFSLFGNAVTLKAEYLYYDLGRNPLIVAATPGAPAGATGYTSRFSNDGHLARVGLNFKFSGY